MKMHMIDNLMSHPPIVLQDVVLFAAGRACDAGGDGEEFGERGVGNVG